MHYEVNCYQLIQAGLKSQTGCEPLLQNILCTLYLLSFPGWLPGTTMPWSRLPTYLKWENTKLNKFRINAALVYVFPVKDIKAPLLCITFIN